MAIGPYYGVIGYFPSRPDNYDGGDILFLRGNVDYKPLRGALARHAIVIPKGFMIGLEAWERRFSREQLFFSQL